MSGDWNILLVLLRWCNFRRPEMLCHQPQGITKHIITQILNFPQLSVFTCQEYKNKNWKKTDWWNANSLKSNCHVNGHNPDYKENFQDGHELNNTIWLFGFLNS